MKPNARFSNLSLDRIARSAQAVFVLLAPLFLALHFRAAIGDVLSSAIAAFSQPIVHLSYLLLGLFCLAASVAIYITRISLVRLRSMRPPDPFRNLSWAILFYIGAFTRILTWLPRHIFGRFVDSNVHDVLRRLEPLGVVVAVLALVYAALGLRLANEERETRRMETQMTFRMMLDDELAATRAPFRSSIDPSEADNAKRSCGRDYPMPLDSRNLLVSKLENFARFGVPLDNIDATFLPLHSLSLEEAELENAAFAWSELTFARFSGSKLEDAVFFCSGLRNAEFTTTDANVRTKLRGSDFRNATLAGADFSGADLRNADFSGARLFDAGFRNADLEGANFEDAALDSVDFADAKGLRKTQINEACFKRNPPKGLPKDWQPPPKKFPCPEYVPLLDCDQF